MRKIAILISLTLATLASAACTPQEIARFRAHIESPAPTSDCQEDEPCWDCPTMGNLTCGPDAPAWMQDGDPATGPE